MRRFAWFLYVILALSGCGSSQEFTAVPKDLDTSKLPRQTVEVKAERFHFTPEEIHVKQGTLLTLKITALDGTHGFDLGAYGIDLTLEQEQPQTVALYAGTRGTYSFHCSHFCGLGHFGMKGALVVE